MLKNYFMIAFRNLIRNKGYSTINICGLAVGMASAMLILIWVENELSYDSFYDKTDRIYRLYSREMDNGKLDVWGNTTALLAPELKQVFGEVEDAVRFRGVFFLTKVGENHFNEGGAFADPGFLALFDARLRRGTVHALDDNSGIVLTEKLAIKLFGSMDCLGQTVVVNDTDNFAVTAVMENQPPNTEFEYQYLLPWNYMTRLGWDANQKWSSSNAATFVLLRESVSSVEFDEKIRNLLTKHGEDGLAREVFTHPLAKVHLYSRAENGKLTGGRIETVRLFEIIAIMILLVACINFMNLSTARSEKRAKEVGIRKIVGAHRSSLIFQFVGESTIMALIGFILALSFVTLVLPTFNDLVGVTLQLALDRPEFWFGAFLLILLTGIVAGSYPAFYLSGSQPLKVLKGTLGKIRGMVTPRKVLVVLQFSFAGVMIICAILVQRQIQYARDRDAGYLRAGLAYNFTQGDVLKNYDQIRNDLLNSGAVISVTRLFSPITRVWGTLTGLAWQGSLEEDKKTVFLQLGADVDFTKTTGARLVQGRDIDIDTYPTDSSAVLLNEKAVEIMRLKDPVGEIIRDDAGSDWHVVGVIRDFIIESPYENVKPMIIQGWSTRYGVVHFRLNPTNGRSGSLSLIEKTFRKYNPEYPFEYYFADEYYERKFGNEKQTAMLITLFTVLTIIISCLGLFGLAAFTAETRTKEIGVRKVLGASAFSITTLLLLDFIKLVVVAMLVATPIAWAAMSNWLQNFTYKVPVSPWVFVLTGLLSVGIALLTIGYQSVKAAVANPVKSLRTE